jgi:hypothetical protein
MAVGPSGRVVIEVDPGLKRDLHEALRADKYPSLRDWFLQQAEAYLNSRGQLRLQLTTDDPRPHARRSDAIPTR